MATVASVSAAMCDRCSSTLKRTVYEVRGPGEVLLRCLRCALRYRPLVTRSFIIALFVGSVLTAINQGNVLLRGDLPTELAWKIPLTYAVPYCVATMGAILNGRRALPPAKEKA